MGIFDRLGATSTRMLGVSSTYTHAGTTYIVNVLIEQSVEFFDELEQVSANANIASFALADLPVKAAKGDTISQNGRTWKVGQKLRDDGYIVAMIVV